MEFIRGLHNIRPHHRGAAVTIGNFDGFHGGHARLIAHLKTRAQVLSAPTLAVLFEPQPAEFFRADAAPTRLMRLSDKLVALQQAGVDYVLALRFDAALAQRPAADFVADILVRQLAVRALVIGDDFRFGADRSGDFALLRQLGDVYGFTVESTITFADAGVRVSSTRLRQALAAGDFATVHGLLGHPYSYRGRVVHGDARGRLLGFPTANVLLPPRPPLSGVFAVTVGGIEGGVWPAVANVGRRPTVGGDRTLLEAHLLDFAGDLYGRKLTVYFHRKIRDEQRFASLDALKAQISADRDATVLFFTEHKVAS